MLKKFLALFVTCSVLCGGVALAERQDEYWFFKCTGNADDPVFHVGFRDFRHVYLKTETPDGKIGPMEDMMLVLQSPKDFGYRKGQVFVDFLSVAQAKGVSFKVFLHKHGSPNIDRKCEYAYTEEHH